MTTGSPSSDSTEHYDGTPASEALPGSEAVAPESIGRYRITSLIARGGFGSVYRAQDQSLERDVAIKVPRRKGTNKSDYSRWMSEARMVAMLDHPNIVPVYDAGSTDEFQFYVVSKYVEGKDLRAYLEQQRPSISQSVEWVIAVADALQHAHDRRLVHRDVKPSNILIDKNAHPWLTDFGLALREEDIGRAADKNKLIGTVNYMSPEQARGEGHLVDGRADIFSLGVILYELLSGSRPFQGGSSQQLLRNIVHAEPRPLRQWDPRLPIELERICMKALAQRRSDRYPKVSDVGEDLKRFTRKHGSIENLGDVDSSADTLPLSASNAIAQDAPIIPKGLRAFDEHDRDFFLKLVPGPRDRDGVPEILRRLRMPIEAAGGQNPFRVGMLYGASGSGKSSLVRAGLIPLLDESVQVVCIESTATHTESRLLRALSTLVSDEHSSRGLVSAMSAIRRGSLVTGRKLLIVLDQFEQWLHPHKLMTNTELVNALRQCDGTHAQCLVLIRDDFWMPATQFFHELEVPLVQDVNSTAVDRFELRHARYVLAEFGRAYDCLPADPGQTTAEQDEFLDAVIDSIQMDGKVISVHLVVLAQMLKGRPWNLKTLSEFGGTEGVDINFLDATFTGSTAAPHHRSLEAPARAVLAELLPDSGTDIKGQMQDVNHLLGVSGLSQSRFDQMLNVLDGELRLITPTVAVNQGDDARSRRRYQLTHDFLVPPLREWLTRSESQTVRGRAKLRLRELSQYWRAKHENRFLPNGLEYLRMVAFTSAANRSSDESKLMSAAARYHGTRWSIALAVVLMALLSVAAIGKQIREHSEQQQAGLMVKQLLAANTDNVPRVIEAMQPIVDNTRPLLQRVIDRDDHSRAEKLHARLALLDSDPDQVQPLVQAVASSRVKEIELICRRLLSYRDQAKPLLWSIIDSDAVDETSWLHAALALAHLDPANSRWRHHADRLVGAIVSQSTPLVVEMAPAFSDLSPYLLDTTQRLFRVSPRDDVQVNAALMLAKSLKASDSLLADLLVSASPTQFEVLFDVASADPVSIVPLLRQELTKRAEPSWPEMEQELDKPAADERMEHALARAGGMLTPSFALCQTLPLERFDSIAAQLNSFGYRPDSVRCYISQGKTFVAAAWHRDGRSWEFTRTRGSDDAMQQLGPMRQRGLFPNDLTSIPVADNESDQIEYGVLWVSLDSSVIDSTMYVGVTEEEHYSAWGPLNDEKYVPKANLKLRHPDGSDRYSSVRWKPIFHPGYVDAWNDFQIDYESRILSGWHQRDVRLNPAGELESELTWAATWWNGGVLESRTTDLLDLKTHLAEADELAGEGFRPASISVVDDGDGLVAASLWHRPHVSEDELDRIAARQANSVVALLRLGEAETLWPFLESRPDSRLRSFLIDRLSALGADPKLLVQRLLGEPNAARRFALIAALAQYRPEQLPIDQAERLRRFILRWGTSDPAAAIHAVCEYLARRWQWDDIRSEIENAQPSDDQFDGPTWTKNQQGQTMVVIQGPVEFQMGSPGHELFRDHSGETTRQVRIPRSYAISAAELTLAEYKKFDPDVSYAADYAQSDQCPINSISWYDAAKYCRWLSEQEGIKENQMCYPRIENIGEGLEMPADYLQRTGYRLPTEAEWEYACRAGTTTTRHFGYSNELLMKYAWTVENPLHRSTPRLRPVKQLLPNDFGLFDTLGNIMEWCQVQQGSSDATKRVLLDSSDNYNPFDRSVLRGSAIFYPTTATRSASREIGRQDYQYPYYGLRIARTMPVSAKTAAD